MMDDHEVGMSKFVEYHDENVFVTVTEADSGEQKKLWLDSNPIAYQRAIVCRGTTCFRAGEVDSKDPQYVVKLSWRLDKCSAEGDLLKLAQHGVEGVAKLIAYHEIISINEMREGLNFGRPYKFRNIHLDASSSFGSQSLSKLVLTRSASQLRGLGITNSSSSLKREATQDGRGSSKRQKSNSQRSDLAHDDVCQALEEDGENNSIETTERQNVNSHNSNAIAFDNRILSCLVISPPAVHLESLSPSKSF